MKKTYGFFDVFQRFAFSALGSLGGWLLEVWELLLGPLGPTILINFGVQDGPKLGLSGITL